MEKVEVKMLKDNQVLNRWGFLGATVSLEPLGPGWVRLHVYAEGAHQRVLRPGEYTLDAEHLEKELRLLADIIAERRKKDEGGAG